MEKRIDIFNILKNEGKLRKIRLYFSNERILDKYEKNVEKQYLNPIQIQAFISDIGFSGLKWKYYGHLPYGSKQIIIEKKYLNAILISDKIEIDNEWYSAYKDDSQNFQYITRENYIVIIISKKQ